MGNYLNSYTDEVAAALKKTLATDKSGKVLDSGEALDMWVDEANARQAKEGRFYFVGNGASATMSEHMAADAFQSAHMLTETFASTSYLTATSNDVSYDDVFSFRISKTAKAGDMLIGISSSGNSPNVVKAIEAAQAAGAFVVTVSGKDEDNKIRKMGDLNFHVPLPTYGLVESAHALLVHCWLDRYLDKYEGGRH